MWKSFTNVMFILNQTHFKNYLLKKHINMVNLIFFFKLHIEVNYMLQNTQNEKLYNKYKLLHTLHTHGLITFNGRLKFINT